MTYISQTTGEAAQGIGEVLRIMREDFHHRSYSTGKRIINVLWLPLWADSKKTRHYAG